MATVWNILAYLNNAINVKTHDKFWDVTHQIIKPVVDTCQNVDWFIVVPEKKQKQNTEFDVWDWAGRM